MVAPNAKSVLDAAMQLSPQDRISLAEQLWRSVDSVEGDELGPEWEVEIQRRLDEIDRGEAILHDGEPILKALKEGRMP